MDALSARQRIIYEYVARGYTPKGIAEDLSVSLQAVYALLRVLIRKGFVRRSSTPNYIIVK